jgi:hypothetical protein
MLVCPEKAAAADSPTSLTWFCIVTQLNVATQTTSCGAKTAQIAVKNRAACRKFMIFVFHTSVDFSRIEKKNKRFLF